MTSLVLYGDQFSSATRLVTCVLEMLGLKYDFRAVDVRKGENLAPAFQKLNPQQSVPVLVDGTFKLTESRAIVKYLVNQHGQGDAAPSNAASPTGTAASNNRGNTAKSKRIESTELLYPRIAQDRARTDEILFFDATTFSKKFQELMSPVLHGDEVDEDSRSKMMGMLHFLNKRVAATGFVAMTDHVTVADIAIFVTASVLEVTETVDLTLYEDLSLWMRRVKELIPNYERANGLGVEKVAQFYFDRVKRAASAK